MDKNAEQKYVVTGVISHIKYADDCKVRLKAENTWKSLDGKEVLNIFKSDSDGNSNDDAKLVDPDKNILVDKKLLNFISLLAVNGSKATFTLEIDKDEKNFTIIGVELSNE